MVDFNERQLRGIFSGWPKTTPVQLFAELSRIENLLIPLIRRHEQWQQVPPLIQTEVERLQALYPSHERRLFAFALDWFARAHESCGEVDLAIWCFQTRLKIRDPRDDWRSAHDVALVDLLVKAGRTAEARNYARRGERFSRRDDPIYAGPNLKQRVESLSGATLQSSSLPRRPSQ